MGLVMNNHATHSQSYLLSVTPVDFSLTAGTSIPAPTPSPPPSLSADLARRPSGGPLTSHPATPNDPTTDHPPQTAPPDVPMSPPPPPPQRDTSHGSRTPTSPASAARYSSSSPLQTQRRAGSVRKLFSLTNLRSSFSSSRTSLSVPRASHDQTNIHYQNSLPSTANTGSTARRPSSPSFASTTGSSVRRDPPSAGANAQRKGGGNWFKRKSGMFLNGDGGSNGAALDAVDEDQRPDTRESKRLKEAEPAPLLPDIAMLGGGKLGGGDIGWDERLFKR